MFSLKNSMGPQKLFQTIEMGKLPKYTITLLLSEAKTKDRRMKPQTSATYKYRCTHSHQTTNEPNIATHKTDYISWLVRFIPGIQVCKHLKISKYRILLMQ